MNRKDIIDYRTLHEQSIYLLQYNIIKDIAVLASIKGLINFKRRNKFDFDGGKITGVLLQENGMFILYGTKMFEICEDDKTFVKFAKDTYNLIKLYEGVVNELGLKIEE